MMTPVEKMLSLKTRSPRRRLSRRQFIAAAGAFGVTAALGDALVTYAPWVDYNKQLHRIWDTPYRNELAGSAQMRELIRYATLAPSGHNAQPWVFAIQGNTIRIFPDYSRRLPVVDPQDRELWISLGCALENLAIAAQSVGYEAEITYPAPDADFLTIHLRPMTVHKSAPLMDAIPHRQNTRSLYDGHAVPLADMKMIEGITSAPEISMRIFTASDRKEAILEYIKASNQRQYGNQSYIDELVSWLRFNKPEALHTMDGLYTRCSGNPDIPRWLGERFITTKSADQQNDTDEKNVRSSSGLIVIAAAQDDKRHWIDTGRLYEQLALTLTANNIKLAFLNQPLELATLRAQFQGYLNLGMAQPQLLLRFGYAAAMPRSLRRPVEQILVSSV